MVYGRQEMKSTALEMVHSTGDPQKKGTVADANDTWPMLKVLSDSFTPSGKF